MKTVYLLCFALALTLLPSLAKAAPEAQPALGELCLLPELDKALARYRQIADQGGWPPVPTGPALHPGGRSDRIPLLAKRLAATADLTAPPGRGDVFDGDLARAVRKFQARHGLSADGVVGAKTLVALNVPVGERIRQLAASLKRCQPLPQQLERRHILVNIADFTLKLYEEGTLLLAMPVIVGKTYRQTPVFSRRITSLILNPCWEVPDSIAAKDLLPKIKKDPRYLDKWHLRVLREWGSDEKIDRAAIDWKRIAVDRFPYRLQQAPGPDNSLGRVKFDLPNPHDVYLHDTPARELFQRDSRAFSSGCIRLARPLELALYLLQGTGLSTMDSLTAAISSQETREIAIPSPIPVYIVYMTAWVDPDGTIQFRPDIYGRNTGAESSATL